MPFRPHRSDTLSNEDIEALEKLAGGSPQLERSIHAAKSG